MEMVRADSSHTAHRRQVAGCDSGRTKAQSRRKYVFNDQIDQLIREIYLNHRASKTRLGIIQAQGMAVARYAEEFDIAWWRITLATWFMSASRLDCWKN